MDQESISKLVPVFVLLVLGTIEAVGGLYFHDKRSKNDITIENNNLYFFIRFNKSLIKILILISLCL